MHPQRKRNRLAGFNYASDGFYFVTICTKKREHHFGAVIQAEMRLSQWGRIAQERWQTSEAAEAKEAREEALWEEMERYERF